MRVLAFNPILLNLITTGAANDPTTYSAWVNSLPGCMQTCFNDFYTGNIQPDCGSDAKSSTKSSDIRCICIAGSFDTNWYDVRNSAETSRCVAVNCVDVVDAAARLSVDASGYTQMCLRERYGDSGSSSSSSSSSNSNSNSSSGSNSNSSSGTGSGSTNDKQNGATKMWLSGLDAILVAGALVLLGDAFDW